MMSEDLNDAGARAVFAKSVAIAAAEGEEAFAGRGWDEITAYERGCFRDLADAALSTRPQSDRIERLEDWTRPIIGIENRTPQEVFDIMVDRIRGLARIALNQDTGHAS